MRSAFRDKENFKLYYDFAIDSNAFAHPNVRMGFLGRGEVERKRIILTQLLEINLTPMKNIHLKLDHQKLLKVGLLELKECMLVELES